jgi:hypothetical protein
MDHDYIEHAVLDCYRFLGIAPLMPARVRFWSIVLQKSAVIVLCATERGDLADLNAMPQLKWSVSELIALPPV